MKKTLLKMIRHKEIVQENMHDLIAMLQKRSLRHDRSKWLDDEFDGFAELDSVEAFKKFGTPEYKGLIENNAGIKLHYERNTHHPEHFTDGINGMSFLDIVEMVVDWKSACETYGNDFLKSLDYSIKRFGCDEKQEWLIRLIARDLSHTP